MVDLTLAAIPFYFATMGAEASWHRRLRSAGTESAGDIISPGDYERNDTLASLAMGVGSLAVPLATKPLMKHFELGAGKWVRPALAVTAGAALTAVVADAVARTQGLAPGTLPEVPTSEGTAADGTDSETASAGSRATRRARIRRFAKRVGGSAAVAAIAGTGVVVAGTLANRTMAHRLWRRRVLPDWGDGPAAALAAVFAWDAIYYWNHRIQHEARYLWAIHVVHHSSEHYNLSTALRQPVSDAFGTFEPEDEPVRYGLTRNIDTFNPLMVAGHEYLDIATDVVQSESWADRVGFVVRGPGWAYERRAEMVGV